MIMEFVTYGVAVFVTRQLCTVFQKLFKLLTHKWTKNKLYLIPLDQFKVGKKNILLSILLVLSILLAIILVYCHFIVLLSVTVICLCKVIYINTKKMCTKKKLDIGYGAAIAYYKNYLQFFLPYNFLERVREFEIKQDVRVEKELVILAPKSCNVPSYLDEFPGIERCRELNPLQRSLSGINNRLYKITVYNIMLDSGVNIRLAIEYAQPLKALNHYKEKNYISEDEMQYQYRIFVDTLRETLSDPNHSYRYCKLVEIEHDEDTVDCLKKIYSYRNGNS